jgi:hypothetical protein
MDNDKDGTFHAYDTAGMKRLASAVRAEVNNDFACPRVTGMLARFWWVGCHSIIPALASFEEKSKGVRSEMPHPWK